MGDGNVAQEVGRDGRLASAAFEDDAARLPVGDDFLDRVGEAQDFDFLNPLAGGDKDFARTRILVDAGAGVEIGYEEDGIHHLV